MTDRILDGRYRLVDLLGSGGMGQVWRCHDPRIGRDVAVKVLLDVRLTDESLARFDREARVAGALASPSIVAVHDYGHGELDGRPVPYLVMELVDGETLDQVVARELAASRELDVGRVLEWTDQVCAALEVAHRVGVVHRDIKPGNVMTAAGGSVKVLDFGIARFVGETHSLAGLTASGVVLGTAGYMSPEQAEGRTLDHRTDLYSVGCLLYFLLTGRPPFEAESFMGVAYKHVTAAPERPSRYRRDLDPTVDALVLELLAKEPDKRPADATAVRDRLARISRPEPPAVGAVTESAPAPAPVPATQPAKPMSMSTPPPPPPIRNAPTRFLMRPARHATRVQLFVVTAVTGLLIAAATAFILNTGTSSSGGSPPPLDSVTTSQH